METDSDVKLELLVEVVIDCCDNVEADWLDVIDDSRDEVDVVIVVEADGLEVLVEVDEVDVITVVEEAIELDVIVEVWVETDDIIVVEVTAGLEEIDDEVDAVEEALELDVLEDCWDE